jgi:hypothetical protein
MDFSERYTPKGKLFSRLVADGMPIGKHHADYSYVIEVDADGTVTSTSRAFGNGSIRYHSFRTYPDAMAHGIKWATRKIREYRREAAKAVQVPANSILFVDAPDLVAVKGKDGSITFRVRS